MGSTLRHKAEHRGKNGPRLYLDVATSATSPSRRAERALFEANVKKRKKNGTNTRKPTINTHTQSTRARGGLCKNVASIENKTGNRTIERVNEEKNSRKLPRSSPAQKWRETWANTGAIHSRRRGNQCERTTDIILSIESQFRHEKLPLAAVARIRFVADMRTAKKKKKKKTPKRRVGFVDERVSGKTRKFLFVSFPGTVD